MARPRNTIKNSKFKHLSAFERGQIATLHKDGHSNREVGRRLRMNLSLQQLPNLKLEESPTRPIFLKQDRLCMNKTGEIAAQKVSCLFR